MIQNNFNKIILNYLQNNSNHAFKKKEIANNLCIKSKYYPQFRNDLKSLTKNGLITKIHGGRFIYISNKIYLIGILSINRSGLGFVDSKNKSVFVGSGLFSGAMHGDKVKVKILYEYKNRINGKIIEISLCIEMFL